MHCRCRNLPPPADCWLQGLRQLAACSSLEHLDLSYCHISGAGLAALRAGHLRHLSSLVLVDCIRATSPPCMMLLTELPALEVLDLSDNKRLDDGSMQARIYVPQGGAVGVAPAAAEHWAPASGGWRVARALSLAPTPTPPRPPPCRR